MWLKQLIGALGALGLIWMVQLVLFAGLFSLTLFLLRQIAPFLRIGHVGVLAVSGALTFLLLAGLQRFARKRGWVGRSATFSPDP